jgi:hypothetical protein
MKTVPIIHPTRRNARLGRTKPPRLVGDFRGRGARAGRPGDGGGEKRRWLKLKREEVDDSGPLSWVYDAALRRLIRGGATIILECLVRLRSRVGGMFDRRKKKSGKGSDKNKEN